MEVRVFPNPLRDFLSQKPKVDSANPFRHKLLICKPKHQLVKIMALIQAIQKEQNVTMTANEAKAYESTLNKCLDLFGKIGASRNNLEMIKNHFLEALDENEESAIRILFWGRDVRGGQGERSVFRTLLTLLAVERPDAARKILPLVSEYGRWDDLFCLYETKVWPDVVTLVVEQLNCDLVNLSTTGKVSLLGKWMPSVNASSIRSRVLGIEFAKALNLTEREYRKFMVQLRNAIRIVEHDMCSGNWGSINYQSVPSKAGMMYRKAFQKHDGARYSEYLADVESGKAKINASTLFPHEVVAKYLNYSQVSGIDETVELMWKNLPNYMEGGDFNGMVLADVSGSMYGVPMQVSIALALYISERNTSLVWKDYFMTFESSPRLMKVVGNTLYSRVNYVSQAPWGGSTNLQAAFELILDAAIKNNLDQSAMPEKLIIVSDMQFNVACRSNKRTNLEQIQKRYEGAGYKVPQLIFWNVNSHSNVPVQFDDSGVALVSGCSPSTMKYVLSGQIVSPVDTMKDVIFSDRYAPVGQALASGSYGVIAP